MLENGTEVLVAPVLSPKETVPAASESEGEEEPQHVAVGGIPAAKIPVFRYPFSCFRCSFA